MPFEQIFGWSGTWDDLPAAHAAAIFFDLLAVALLFLLGRRMRGPTLGVALAYAWVSYPFTLFALESNSNDTLVAVLLLAALLAATLPLARSRAAPRRARGAGGPDQVRARSRSRRCWRRTGCASVRAGRRPRARGVPSSASCSSAPLRWPDPGARARLAAHDLRAHDRLPGRPRLAVLGLGAVRAGRRPQHGRADRRRSRWRSCSRSCRAAADLVGLAAACAAILIAAQLGDRTLVLPVHPLVLPARDDRPARALQRRRRGRRRPWHQNLLDRVGPQSR